MRTGCWMFARRWGIDEPLSRLLSDVQHRRERKIPKLSPPSRLGHNYSSDFPTTLNFHLSLHPSHAYLYPTLYISRTR